jgi:hypothetical protein
MHTKSDVCLLKNMGRNSSEAGQEMWSSDTSYMWQSGPRY